MAVTQRSGTARKQAKGNPTTMRLSVEGRRLLRALADRYGVTQTAVMEFAVRAMAEQNGLLGKEGKRGTE